VSRFFRRFLLAGISVGAPTIQVGATAIPQVTTYRAITMTAR
jgi:hypothetical protein